MFLLLAFSLTIGSVMTPIGNPQNILIAERSGLSASFIKFVAYLAIPTAVNLLVTPYILIKYFKVEDREVRVAVIPHEALKDRRDAIVAAIGIATSVAALVINDGFQLMGLPYIPRRGFIPFIVAAGIYMVSRNPRKLLSSVDWGTIVFFITMFITMEGVWRSHILDPLLAIFMPIRMAGISSLLSITAASIVGSQLISNVPFTRLLIKYMKSLGYTGSEDMPWLTLAMSTTIAGNLTLLGAASNIIIVEYLEVKMNTTISFTEFLKIGVVVTVVNTLVYILTLTCEYVVPFYIH